MTFQENAKLGLIRQILKSSIYQSKNVGLYVLYKNKCYTLDRIQLHTISSLRFGEAKDYCLTLTSLDDKVSIKLDVYWTKEQLANAVKTKDEILKNYPEYLV